MSIYKPSHKPRIPANLGYLWFGQGRERMLQVAKNLDIVDICTCERVGKSELPWRYRPNSGKVGMRECLTCHHLLWPLSYVFECDECTEPFLVDHFPIFEDEECLCFDCAIGN